MQAQWILSRVSGLWMVVVADCTPADREKNAGDQNKRIVMMGW